MPVISTRYSTTTGSSYLSPSSSSTLGTYRSTLGSDRGTSSIDRPSYASATESYLNRSRSTYRSSLSSTTGLGLSGIGSRDRDVTPSSSSYRHSTYLGSYGRDNGNDSLLGSKYAGATSSSSAVSQDKSKSINTLIDSLNQKLQSLEKTVEQKKKVRNLVYDSTSSNNGGSKANGEVNGGTREPRGSSYSSGFRNSYGEGSGSANNNVIMPSSTSNGFSTSQENNPGSLKATRLQIGLTGAPAKSMQNGATPTSNGNGVNIKRAALNGIGTSTCTGSSYHRDENFLKNEYETARNQVIGNGNTSSVTITNKVAKSGLAGGNNNNNSGINVNVNGRNIINVNHQEQKASDDELDKVRSKILSKVNANNMMINGEHVADEDIKFIDSDDSSPQSAASINPSNIPQSANKVLIINKPESSPLTSSSHHKSTSSTPSSDPTAAKSKSNLSNSASNSMSTTTTVTIGGSRMRVITSTTDDTSDQEEKNGEECEVSASATIVLPKRSSTAKVMTNGDHENSASTGSELSSIFLEKKNLSNKLSDSSNDSIRNASSLRSALPPTPATSVRSWDRDSGLGGSGSSTTSSYSRYSSRSSNNYDSDSSTSSYILPRSSALSSSRSGSPGKDYSSSYERKTERESTEGLCGLWNIGNTCFMNSVLQCLSNTSELTKAIKTLVPVRSTGKDQRIFTEFQDLIKQMWRSGNRSVNPSEFKMAFSSKHRMYSGSAQQDSQEFLRFFIDSVHSALNTATKVEPITIDDSMSDSKKSDLMWHWYSKTENSVIKDLFAGQLRSTLKCTVCENTSNNFDPFWDLSLPLPSNTRCKLSDCLDLFIKEEVLDGDEMPTCSKCKTRRKCTKSFTIQRFPKILVIHLKRFSETRWSKLTTLVEFPTGESGLNLAPYASSSCSDSSNATYSLYATSNHMGSTAGGHYVAFCKHPNNRRWYEYNDNSVTEASESSLVSSSAYLLFYERV